MWGARAIFYILGAALLVSAIKIASMILQDLATQRDFHAFVERYNKSYGQRRTVNENGSATFDDGLAEFYRRFRNFEQSIDQIETLNAQRTHDESAIYGLTQFADMTRDEFLTAMLTKRKNLKVARPKAIPIASLLQRLRSSTATTVLYRAKRSLAELPASFSWLDEGRVSAVRNQGQCGACWAHSVVATIESMVAIEHNTTEVRQLSVQQMVDCAGNNRGCAGGDTCNLLQWLVLNDVPIASERSYPLTSVQSPCSVERATHAAEPVRVRMFTCENLVNQEERMMEYLATIGPITVGVNAVSWQYYLGGVIQHHCDGGAASLNHAVQIVGYNRTGELPYFLARNSWGDHFGDRGFVRIQMGRNVCGVAMQVSAIVVA